MSLLDDLDAMARAQGEREAARAAPAPRGRGRHRAPTPPFWALRPAARHQRRSARPDDSTSLDASDAADR